MDNGHSAPTNSAQPFFTVGQGVDDANKNSFEAENNLNTSDNPTEWASPSPNRNLGAVGNKIMGPYRNNEAIQSRGQEQLGEVIDIAMPPNLNNLNEAANDEENADTHPYAEEKLGAEKRKNGTDIIKDTQNDVEKYYKGKISPAEVINRLQEESDAFIQTEFGRELGK